uniref:SCP domain-containing protein n=1 Tax=Mesocestoides corti TaxID=53468 RepID=A0A5K3FWU9_MESCO
MFQHTILGVMLKLLVLLILTWLVLADVPTVEERKAIVECHTKLREHVNPPASNMMLMNYTIEMENLAVKYLADCRPPTDGKPFEGTSDLTICRLPENYNMLRNCAKSTVIIMTTRQTTVAVPVENIFRWSMQSRRNLDAH